MASKTESEGQDLPVNGIPILLLDVDGVVNALMRSDWPEAQVSRALGFDITTSKHLGAALLQLLVEIRWLTTWAEEANEHISDLCGLPNDLPVSGHPVRNLSGFDPAWKIRCAARVAEEGRDIIWIDDDLSSMGIYDEDSARETLSLGSNQRIKIVQPNAWVGLTPAHIEEIKEWL